MASSYGPYSSTPSVSATGSNNKQAFIQNAINFVGLKEADNSYREIFNRAGIYQDYYYAWCAAFVSACAKLAGISSIIPPNTWAYGIGDGIFQAGGKSIPGQASSWHCDVTPAVGDTVHFGSGGAVDANGFPTANGSGTVSHVGIVVAVDSANRKFTTIEGNSSDAVQQNTYSFGCSRIYYCARPNWAAVGGFSEPVILTPNGDASTDPMSSSTGYMLSNANSSPLNGITVYRDVRNGTPNDRHDMTIREIGYFSNDSKFVTEETPITISAINYTTLLGNLYDQFATYYPYGYNSNTDRLSGNIKVCVDFFIGKGLSPAAASGITACLYVLSGIGTNHNGGGICDWQGKYRYQMHNRLGRDWHLNLSGQLDFLWTDLTSNYDSMLQLLINMPVTDSGARQAANRFMVSYRYTDQPQDIDTEISRSTRAQNIAVEWFNHISITTIVPEGASVSTPESITIPIGGDHLATANMDLDYAGGVSDPLIEDTAILPSPQAGMVYSFAQCPYPQNGIDTNFTSYSYWADRFNRSSPQYKLAQIWKNQYNMSCNRGIAMITGYYLAAVTSTFGTVGDAIQVNLVDGQKILIIIADIKSPSDSNYCQWGHLQGGKVNVVEWEIVKVQDGHAVMSNSNTAGYPPDISDWRGVAVESIKHIGKKFDLRWG